MKRLTALAALLLLTAAAPDEARNGRIFDRVWSLVGKRYWDRTMAGLDWKAMRDTYRSRAIASASDVKLYLIINDMLRLLGDSHVYVALPTEIDPSADMTGWGRRSARLEGGILLLAFDQFAPGDDRWIARTIAEQPAPAGIILDLRANGGGRDDVLDRIAGQFVRENQVLLRLTSDRTIEERTRGASARSWSGPLAVLVGPRTASAAEILAFFLDELGRAHSIGEPTKGAVTGGVEYDLPDGGLLTIAEYDIRTANGVRLERHGFTPKHIVGASENGIGSDHDQALKCAIMLLKQTANACAATTAAQ